MGFGFFRVGCDGQGEEELWSKPSVGQSLSYIGMNVSMMLSWDSVERIEIKGLLKAGGSSLYYLVMVVLPN